MVFEEMLNQLLAGVPYAMGWHCIYWISRILSNMFSKTYRDLPDYEKGYWGASVVSVVHGFYIAYAGYMAVLEIDMFNSLDFFLTTDYTTHCCLVLMGYIMSDWTLAVYYGSKWGGWQANLIHHTCAIFTWSLLLAGGYGHLFAMVCSMCEATSPSMNLRWFLDKMNLKATTLYLVNGVVFLILWTWLRVYMFGWMGYRIYLMREQFFSIPVWQSIALLANYGVGYALQLFWFLKIVKGAYKALFGGKSAAKSKKK